MEAVSPNSNSDYHSAEEDVTSLPPPAPPQDCASADGRCRWGIETAGGTPGRPLLSTSLRPSRGATATAGFGFTPVLGTPIRPRPWDAALPVPQSPTQHGVPAAAPLPPLGLTNKRKSRETPAGGLARKIARSDDCSLFPCPFHQNNPGGFSTRACSGRGFRSYNRLKEHLHRVHDQPEYLCVCCNEDLVSWEGLYRHQATEKPCKFVAYRPVDGIMSPFAAGELRGRTRWPKGVSEVEKVEKTYSLIFSDSEVPPHNYGPLPSSWSDTQSSRATVYEPASSVHSLPTHNTTTTSNGFDNPGQYQPRLATNDAGDDIAELCAGLRIDEETRSELARRIRDRRSKDAQAPRGMATSRAGLESVLEDNDPAELSDNKSNSNAAHRGAAGHDDAGLSMGITGFGAQLPLPEPPVGELNHFDEATLELIVPYVDFGRLMAVMGSVEELGLRGRTP